MTDCCVSCFAGTVSCSPVKLAASTTFAELCVDVFPSYCTRLRDGKELRVFKDDFRGKLVSEKPASREAYDVDATFDP